MLAALMYHRAGTGKHSNDPTLLEKHLGHIKEHYNVVLPGDPLKPKKLSVCLTFDDATFDFYHIVFPLLQKFQLRALLAVPVDYILEKTTLPPELRLSVPYTLAMQEGFYQKNAPFCTFEELNDMVTSGHVEVASHSRSHPNMTYPHLDLKHEVVESKQILEDNLPQVISSFVYPFGKVNAHVHQYVNQHYPYSFRIGSGLNFSWVSSKKPLMRLPCDHLTDTNAPFIWSNIAKTFLKRCASAASIL